MHGLYHEDRDGPWDDLFQKTRRLAEEEIRAGLEIFQEVGIKSNVFVPPRWKLCEGCMVVLNKLGFDLAEMQEELLYPYLINSLENN